MSIRKAGAGAIGTAIAIGLSLAYAADPPAKPAPAAASSAMAASGATADKPAAAAAATARPADGRSAAVAGSDRKFIEKAAAGSMLEVELGKLAQERGSDAKVKEFGARMVQDHGKAVDELKQMASDKSLKLPDQANSSQQKETQKFAKLSGADFDRKYASAMVKDHKKDIAEFEKASKSAKDPQVKEFAGKTLPTLREHLKMAQSAEAAVRKSSH